MKYTHSSGISVEVLPWMDCGFKLASISLNASLGGAPSEGVLNLEGFVTSEETNQATENLDYGTIYIEKDNRPALEVKFFVIKREYIKDVLRLRYICISDPKYARDKKKQTYRGTLDEVLNQIYPNTEISCDTDVQGELTFHQNNMTDIELFAKLASGYKRSAIYGFIFDKYMIRETYTLDDLENAKTVKCTRKQLKNRYSKTYNPELYTPPFNAWEDSEKNGLGKDYKDKQPRFIRSIQKRGEVSYVSATHGQLYENSMTNDAYLNSNFFHRQDLELEEWPDYSLGEVVIFNCVEDNDRDTSWPHKYYLVYSLKFFIAGNSSIRENGKSLSFQSTFVGLEEDGSIALDKEEGEDPSKKDESKDPIYYREGDVENENSTLPPALG
jgi:hypothetical protein